MLSRDLIYSSIRNFKSKLVNSKPYKVKSSLKNYVKEKVRTFSTRVFRRKNNKFIVSEVSTSPSGLKTNRIRNILKNIKRKWNQFRPYIPRIVCGLIRIFLVFVNVRSTFYFAQFSFRKFLQHASLNNNRLGREILACTLTPVPKRVPFNPNRLLKPTLPKFAPTSLNDAGNSFWARSQVSLIIPETQFCPTVVRKRVFQDQLKKILGLRGGTSLTLEMWAALIMATHARMPKSQPVSTGDWVTYLNYLNSFLNNPIVTRVVKHMCYATGWRKTGIFMDILINIQHARVNGFSLNPGDLGSLANPITQMEKINQIKMPHKQNDKTPIGIRRNNTDVILSTCTKQCYKKQKHFNGEFVAPGQKPVDAWSQHLLGHALDPSTQLYRAEFNNRFKMVETAIVALFRNATHNYGEVFTTGPNGELLDENFQLSPKDKEEIGFVLACFRTAYNFTKIQMEKLEKEGKVQ